MTLDLPILDLLAALFGGGAVVLGLIVGGGLLLRRDAQRVARWCLGGFLIAGALTLANELNGTLRLHRLSDHFWILPLVYTYALGPLLYLFVRQRLVPERGLHRPDLAHAVLPAFQVVHQVAIGFAPIAVKGAYWRSSFGQVYSQLDTLIFVASFGGYLLACWRLTQRPAAPLDLVRWLRRLIAGAVVILAVALAMESSLVTPVVVEALPAGVLAWLDLGATLTYAAMLYWVTFTGFVRSLAQGGLAQGGLAPRATSSVMEPTAPPKPARRERYGMTPDDLAHHTARLRDHVATTHPYLDPTLSLGTLADALRLSEKELSLVLNEGLGLGYTEYVNGLRVAEAQRGLADPDQAEASVLQIALDAGFASKATFNRAFKQVAGCTPTQYRAAALPLLAS
ncbi:MAG: helix-turn-helix transcriptional regulator [Bacteroidota bacterium]